MLTELAIAVTVSAAVYVGLPHLMRSQGERRLRARCARQRALVLTYDDGPSEQLTGQLLELLQARGVRATFFMQGRRIEEHPEVARAVVEAGHEVGSHSHDHLHPWKVAPWRAAADLRRGAATVKETLGGAALLRPPYGKFTAWTWLVAWRARLPVAWWTVDAGDSWEECPDPGAAATRISADGGGVVLFHDLDRDAFRDRFVLDATERVLSEAEAAGLRVMAIGELADPAT